MAALDNCYNIFDMREAAKRRLPRVLSDRRCSSRLALFWA